MKKISDALSSLVTAASVNAADKVKITALLQAQSGDEDLALELQPAGAPDPAAYKSKSGGIVSVLEDMLEKAKAELADAQKAKATAQGELDTASKTLSDSETHLKDLQQ